MNITNYLILISLSFVAFSNANAGAFHPGNDDDVLVQIKHAGERQKQAERINRLQQDPRDKALLYTIVDNYLALGRKQGDERYFSYAEAVLQPYIEEEDDVKIMLLWADILQHGHQFTQASEILAKVIERQPDNVKARLMRYVINLSKGFYSEAMTDCRTLIGNVDMLTVTTCMTQIKSLTGSLVSSQQLLSRTLKQYSGHESEVKNWSKTILVEMALRAGQQNKADEAMVAALNVNPDDYYVLALYADNLMQQSRYQAVIELLSGYKHIDKLLLRLVIAEKRLHGNSKSERDLTTRIRRIQQLGGSAHLRMVARYYLDVKNDVSLALENAWDNWQQQREPDDAMILARSLVQANDNEGLKRLTTWLRKTGMQDSRIDSIIINKESVI